MPWRRERLPTPVFWPGEFHGLYSPWGCKELDTTEWLSLSLDRCTPVEWMDSLIFSSICLIIYTEYLFFDGPWKRCWRYNIEKYTVLLLIAHNGSGGWKHVDPTMSRRWSEVKWSCSVVSNSLRHHGLSWNSLSQNTGVGSLSLLQGIFPIQGLSPGLPHCRRILYQLSQ